MKENLYIQDYFSISNRVLLCIHNAYEPSNEFSHAFNISFARSFSDLRTFHNISQKRVRIFPKHSQLRFWQAKRKLIERGKYFTISAVNVFADAPRFLAVFTFRREVCYWVSQNIVNSSWFIKVLTNNSLKTILEP